MLHSDRHDGKQTASREFLAFLLESSATALRRSVEEGVLDRNREAFIVSRRRLRLTSEQATALRDQLRSEESAILELDNPDGALTMSYVFALFPLDDHEGGQ
jgi:hypothetical protein